ncbi:MAG: Rrf2 family transcriptional regulator [SAR324 cluster bacterium]|nr:Rrf2 family transcriptional regulator [SAR324 cluster bacterium]
MFSKKCSYAIRAILYLATLQSNNYIKIDEIAEELDIPFHFLTKILQILTHKDLSITRRGPKGGIALDRPFENITLFEIAYAVDGEKYVNGCALGLAECKDDSPCPLHDQYIAERDRMVTYLKATTIGEMSKKIKHLDLRLTKDYETMEVEA